ncbi:MAG: CBS domain-containing protein [Phycisphaerae bacterium]|nr:CBS domain-containing protein [Phycisphaerae bacterium]NIP52483.1 CBS domain-containing protein [Phycisphaerae bacterium]NIS51476.1 CBS domain-containing protein [Phycisphaerae bacterium]NIU08003.1 CBS domain-containing protein [Phycisphaerae bacterium]NIU56748.1 CBS domain-containing protein [Phycisphaerae bacterium]
MESKEQVSNLANIRMRDSSSDCLMNSLRIQLTVQEVMSKDIITISPAESLLSAAMTMCDKNISCILVLDNDTLAGILTETDLLKRIASREKDYSKITMAETMSSPVQTISSDSPVLEAIRIMEDRHIKRLPVLDQKRLVGIITQTNLTRLLASSVLWRNVVEIMTLDVAGLQCKASVADAAEVMTSRQISCIVTLEENEVVGVLTERDLLKRVVSQQKDPADIKLEEVMSSPVISVPPDCPVFTAGRIMENLDIRRLVVTEDKHLCGMLTQTDIFRAVKQKLELDIVEMDRLHHRLRTEHSFTGIVGRDARMLELFETIREVAQTNVSVLIQGESGTGKELVAEAIHNESPLSDKPFVPVNCGALPEGVLESELFGHVKGAFTGAVRDRKGRFELADGGTIFLDEIGEIPSAMQVKLLRVLQKGAAQHLKGQKQVKSSHLASQQMSFQPVGGEKSINVDVRVICATNKNLAEEVAAGRFREDLYYRLCVVPIHLPPLRQRRNDIPLLAEHLLKKGLKEMGRRDVVISPEAVSIMIDYDWPGNVRELENALQYALVKCRDNLLLPEHLPSHIYKADTPTGPCPKKEKKKRKHKLDIETVWQTLAATGGNKIEAAHRLGVSRATLYRFIEESEKTGKIKAV